MPPYENEDDILAGLYGLSIEDDDGGGDGNGNEDRRPRPLPLTGVKVEVRTFPFLQSITESNPFINNS